MILEKFSYSLDYEVTGYMGEFKKLNFPHHLVTIGAHINNLIVNSMIWERLDKSSFLYNVLVGLPGVAQICTIPNQLLSLHR